MGLTLEKRQTLDAIFKKKGYTDYKWIDPKKIIVTQWVRMKCKFGCTEYGRGGACPPNTPSVAECEQFFSEYSDAAILHFDGTMNKPEDRHKINSELVKLEREVFLAGYERAFLLSMDSCGFCKECTGDRQTCKEPRMARPTRRPWPWTFIPPCANMGFPSTCEPITIRR